MNDSLKTKQRKLASYQARMRREPTAAEAKVKDALESVGLHFVFQKGFLRGKTLRIVDFWFPSPVSVILEVDGGYHLAQAYKDRVREEELKAQRKRPIRIVRVTNDWVFKQESLGETLAKMIYGRSL